MKKSFQQSLDSCQYNACWALTRAIRDALRETVYKDLGLESLQLNCLQRKFN